MGLSKSTYHEIVDGIIKISGLPEGVFVLCQNGCAIDRSLSLRSADFASTKKCCEDVCGGPIVVESGSQKVAPHLSVTGALVESADLRMEGWTLSYRVQPGALRR